MATATDPTGRGRKARTITATDPLTGATLTRSTDRIYWAAIVRTSSAGKVTAAAWAGRPDLAAKALAQRGGEAKGYRLAPVTADPWATPTPEPVATPTPEPVALPPVAPAPVAPYCLAQAGPAAARDQARAARAAALALEATAPPAGSGVAAHRAAAAAGRPVSLAALARDLGQSLGLAAGGRVWGPAAPLTGDPLEGLPWDPGTPAARALVADQGRRAAILWPVAQAIRGAGHPLPPAWASDGPVLNGQVGPVSALAALPAALLESAAAALAALPPVTQAQAQALQLLRDALAR